MASVEQAYRYLAPSSVGLGADATDVTLATSGGRTATGPAVHPRFFEGFLGHPEQSAACLLAVARVARTRFYMPPNMVAAIIRAADPVVTSNGDRLRFESFSACAGVYARYDVLPSGLDGTTVDNGTTNVDFNPPMREALARVGGSSPVHLQVGVDDVTVTTFDDSVVERKVPLPTRWIKGFAEVQVAAAGMALVAELSGTEARRFLKTLPTSSRGGPSWVLPAGRSLRLGSRPAPGGACLAGPERLRAFETLARFARALRVYSPPASAGAPPLPSTWELVLDDARIVVGLSPEVRRGFSGEGGVLADLADEQAADDADLVAVLLAWEPRIDTARLARDAGISEERVTRALAHLGAAGRVGFDLAEGAYFHRELPFDPAVLEAMHPRLRDARALLDAGAVTFDGEVAVVASGDIAYRVRWVDGEPRCTCPWWGKHQGDRGPCKHALAASLARQA